MVTWAEEWKKNLQIKFQVVSTTATYDCLLVLRNLVESLQSRGTCHALLPILIQALVYQCYLQLKPLMHWTHRPKAKRSIIDKHHS